MRALAAIAAAVLIAGSLAAQEPATGSAEPEAAPAGAEGTTSGARQIIEVRLPPRDVLRDTLLVVLGGVITGAVGLVAGWLLFRHERKERKRTIAAVLAAELNHILSAVDASIEASDDQPRLAIEGLRVLESRNRVHKAVLPQIGELGVHNANAIVNLYYVVELVARIANSIDLVRTSTTGGPGRAQFSDCFKLAEQLRGDTRELYRSLITQFLPGEQITKEIEGARDDGRSERSSS